MNKLNDDQIILLAAGIVRDTKHIIQKGYLVLIKILGYIPENEKACSKALAQTNKKVGYTKANHIRNFYDALDFLKLDPYGLFENYGSENVYKIWTQNLKEGEEDNGRYLFD